MHPVARIGVCWSLTPKRFSETCFAPKVGQAEVRKNLALRRIGRTTSAPKEIFLERSVDATDFTKRIGKKPAVCLTEAG
jgi:hypothetical protein